MTRLDVPTERKKLGNLLCVSDFWQKLLGRKNLTTSTATAQSLQVLARLPLPIQRDAKSSAATGQNPAAAKKKPGN